MNHLGDQLMLRVIGLLSFLMLLVCFFDKICLPTFELTVHPVSDFRQIISLSYRTKYFFYVTKKFLLF